MLVVPEAQSAGNTRTGQVARAHTVLLLDDAPGCPRAVVGTSHLTPPHTAAAAVAVDAVCAVAVARATGAA